MSPITKDSIKWLYHTYLLLIDIFLDFKGKTLNKY